ncbi:MAG: asparagine synthase-related protein, partial [Ilumatobacteraceae bacterium]
MTYSLMSIEEIVLGAAFEISTDHPARPVRAVHRPPQEVLGDVLLDILQRGRMAIAFSGGVDSSGLLCLATTVARAHALAEPVAVTARFPDAPSTDESRWQELVIAHLGLADWVKVDFHDECDVIGEEAQIGLRRYGVRWPPLVYAEQPLMRACPGSIYVMGNGGDELTFPTRAGVLQLVAHGTVRRNRAALRSIAGELRPELPWLPGRSAAALPAWVRPEARGRLSRIVSGHPYRRMFRWAPALENRTNAPWARRGHATVVHSGVDAGVELAQPLTDPAVVGAMLVAGGRWGFPDRATAAAALFGDSLPQEIRRRSDKVDFT